MFRRLFWLGAIAGIGYLIWRWVRQQNEAPPHAGTTMPHIASSSPAAPASLATPSGEPPAAPAGPRRIPTRVHRGAPPSAPTRTATSAEAESPATLIPAAAPAEEPNAPAEPERRAAAPRPTLTNINTADEETLIALPGIGPAIARRIIAYRDEHGPFATIEDLAAIQGIGPRNLDEFRHLVTV